MVDEEPEIGLPSPPPLQRTQSAPAALASADTNALIESQQTEGVAFFGLGSWDSDEDDIDDLSETVDYIFS
jgi:hypothetical protein